VTDPGLKAQLQQESNAALKSGDRVRLGALRMLTSAIRYREVEVGHDLSDDEVREVAAREVKKRSEAAEAFRDGGRTELAEQEESEREAIAPYAPEQLSDAEVDAMIDEAIAATGATTPREMGKVMGMVMGKAKGRVDGGVVQEKVKARLGG
jgi:uncharacterized protein YqeY